MIDAQILKEYGATYRQVSQGEAVFTEGQACLYYYQIVSGRVKWVNLDEQGKEFIQVLVGPGESFGEFPLFDNGPYAASAFAECDTELIRLSKSTFLELLDDHPEILFHFTVLLTKRLRFKSSLLQSFVSHSPQTRISHLINHLLAEKKNICEECNQLKLTRQQIADMTGLRVETVIRTIRLMHAKNELLINKGKVYCKNMIVNINP